METTALLAGLQLAANSGTPGPTGVQRFEQLMQSAQPARTPAPEQRQASAGQAVYIDAAAPAGQASGGVRLSPEVSNYATDLVKRMRIDRFDRSVLSQTPSPDELPVVTYLREHSRELVNTQIAFTQFTMTMKGVELSTQGMQQLFKMQG
jgi:hypothetical protein